MGLSAMGSTRLKKYITSNRGTLFYTRSIPQDVKHLDPRPDPIQKSLQTRNLDIALSRRDLLAEMDEKLWRSLRALEVSNQSKRELATAGKNLMELLGTEQISFEPSSLPVGKAGLDLINLYQMQAEEIFSGPPEEIMESFKNWLPTLPADIAENYRMIVRNMQLIGPAAEKFKDPSQIIAATMGVHNDRKSNALSTSEALDGFFDKFAVAHMANMSPSQKKNYTNPKKRAVKRFISLVGDVVLEDVTRDQAVQFKDHWLDLIHRPDPGKKALTRSGALKEIQDLHYIWQCYADEYKWKDYYGHAKSNPFGDLKKHFPAPPKKSVRDDTETRVTFSNAIIRKLWLQGTGLTGTNEELRHILYTLVETGCNPQEILHLTTKKICLDHVTPHILIQPTLEGDQKHIVKTNARVRAVPLVGIALEAIKRNPNGFPRYYDKGNSFSAAANKFLLANKLRTKETNVGSLRHEFSARMRTHGVPEHIQRHIVGHAADVHGVYGAFPDQPDFDNKLTEMASYMHEIALPFDKGVL